MKRRAAAPILAGLSLFAALVAASCENPAMGGGDSAFITQVFDFKYAPGQHAGSVGTGALYDPENFVGESSAFISLGGWGGYIVGGFSSDIPNSSGEYDFAVFTQPGVGNEPAVIFVMPDDNGNGLPDDTWYEIAGSEADADYSAASHAADKYIRNYQVTYTKAASDNSNITWTDNQDSTDVELIPGFPETDAYSSSWWWAGYGADTSVTFTGVKLPDVKYSYVDSGTGDTYWTDYSGRFASGYAENYDGTDLAELPFRSSYRPANRFDIGDAINSDGSAANLTAIRFIKVQSAVFQVTGWLNEVSTEVSGAVNLHTPGYESYR